MGATCARKKRSGSVARVAGGHAKSASDNMARRSVVIIPHLEGLMPAL
jgi:hypothetical protein